MTQDENIQEWADTYDVPYEEMQKMYGTFVFCQNFRRIRLEVGKSLEEISEATGIPLSRLRAWDEVGSFTGEETP